MNPHLRDELTEILRGGDEPRSGLSREQLKTLALELAAAMPPSNTVLLNRTAEELDVALDQLDGILDLAAEDMPAGRSSKAIFGALRIVSDARRLAQSIVSATMPKARAKP